MKKTSFGILICLCLLCGIMPVTALADAGVDTHVDHPACGSDCVHTESHAAATPWIVLNGTNTGLSQSRMVTDLYAHTHNEDHRRLAQKVEEDFFQKRPSETKKAAANETDLAYRLLQENPDIAKLIIATLQKQGS